MGKPSALPCMALSIIYGSIHAFQSYIIRKVIEARTVANRALEEEVLLASLFLLPSSACLVYFDCSSGSASS